MASKWTPVSNGIIHTDGPESVEVDGRRIIVYQHYHAWANLPDSVSLCRLEDAPPHLEVKPEWVAALRRYLNAYYYRDKDWGGPHPELEAAYNVLKEMLAEMEGAHDGTLQNS